ncbi:methylated-DNA--[protein]-cysteine S-methyltransferase [Spiroplasma endosymbiont of Ammophila pubescens]|uniref:methylated-DNA--[protein]-cysteine S-methyltransferase n=1 Tax=Spiroplasma endosymbiont of Ammophila pubescens TaxID=3066315 RepID=UPI0032B0F833
MVEEKGTKYFINCWSRRKNEPCYGAINGIFNGKTNIFYFSVWFHWYFVSKKVWAEIAKIPFGTTTCYADIAQKIGHPQAMRAVGTAIGNNAITILVPCHRVLGKNNALRGYRGGLEMKALLLQLENIW